MKLYIAGPMTGLPDYNYPEFFDAACKLALLGYEVVNPARIGVDPNRTYADYIRSGIELLLEADHVATLFGWQESGGARLEVQVAEAMGMQVSNVDYWALRAREERA